MGALLRTFIAAACLAVLPSAGAEARNITSQDWGTTQSGEKASLFTLKGAHGLEARITNYGGTDCEPVCAEQAGRKDRCSTGI